jgi:hypothetical protein
MVGQGFDNKRRPQRKEKGKFMIKAIDTIYNGYKFRSRLEARWAVFLDYLRIKYEYEKEGYILSDGTHYLPDFWLPLSAIGQGGGFWLEIKPQELSTNEILKIEKLVYETGHNAFAFVGNVGLGEFVINVWFLDRKEKIVNTRQIKDVEYPGDNLWDFYGMFGYNDRTVEDAIVAARSARFEFNQTAF